MGAERSGARRAISLVSNQTRALKTWSHFFIISLQVKEHKNKKHFVNEKRQPINSVSVTKQIRPSYVYASISTTMKETAAIWFLLLLLCHAEIAHLSENSVGSRRSSTSLSPDNNNDYDDMDGNHSDNDSITVLDKQVNYQTGISSQIFEQDTLENYIQHAFVKDSDNNNITANCANATQDAGLDSNHFHSLLMAVLRDKMNLIRKFDNDVFDYNVNDGRYTSLICWLYNLKLNIPDESFRSGIFSVVSELYMFTVFYCTSAFHVQVCCSSNF